ncbi:expressed unknown protein [Seminavis robusta]|uniref:Uncharacterized protein n=1 Tax=Seminavis robusta TaxID=568900 RepID=A0A9N8EJ02_9STRA|nr:expressed unknown protein [Seminavis robusta]|eukprot:Sro1032_g233640.1 n/a (191) ;mRNA; f:37355-37927
MIRPMSQITNIFSGVAEDVRATASTAAAKLESTKAAAKLEYGGLSAAAKLEYKGFSVNTRLGLVKLEDTFSALGDKFYSAKAQKEREIEEKDREARELDRMQKDKAAEEEGRRQCLEIIRNHLIDYLEHNTEATFEEWLADLHPENAKTGELDSRFLIPGNPWAAIFEEEVAHRPKPTCPPRKLHRVISV